jgi:diguanylate cyclase (GGDEF)-like protein
VVYSPLTYYLVPDDLLIVTLYNFSLPVLGSILFLTFYKRITVERKNVVLLLYTIIMGITPILLLYHTDPSNYSVYFLNLVLPMVAIYVGFGLSFALAFLSSTTLLLFFFVTFLLINPNFIEVFHHLLNIIGAYVLSALGAYASEKSKRTQFINKYKEHELITQTLTDPLTGLHNRRFLDEHFTFYFNQAIAMHKEAVCIMIDIDFFKKYNDTYGHQEGDRVLQKVSYLINDIFHQKDEFSVRYGGEEFCIFLLDSPIEYALQKMDDLKKTIESLEILHEKNSASNFVTVSAGLYPKMLDTTTTFTSLIKEADELLYNAKAKGRNTICA